MKFPWLCAKSPFKKMHGTTRCQTILRACARKTAIALALLRNAPVLFLDEPTSGLDPAAIDEFNALVSELAANGATIFMVTHGVYGACQVAHRIVLLSNGKLTGSFERVGDMPIDTEAVHAAFAGRKA